MTSGVQGLWVELCSRGILQGGSRCLSRDTPRGGTSLPSHMGTVFMVSGTVFTHCTATFLSGIPPSSSPPAEQFQAGKELGTGIPRALIHHPARNCFAVGGPLS